MNARWLQPALRHGRPGRPSLVARARLHASALSLSCLLAGWLFGLRAAAFGAAPVDPDAIPPLRPPRGELPPTFWEEHGAAVVVAALVLILLLAVVVWFFTRPKPPVVISPEAQARRALGALRAQPEQGPLLSQVSQILRHYLATAFELPPGEMTTAEFCRALAQSPRPSPELGREVSDFLRRCDERKFAPGTAGVPPVHLQPVPQALQFIDRAEARLAELRAAQAAHSAPASKGT